VHSRHFGLFGQGTSLAFEFLLKLFDLLATINTPVGRDLYLRVELIDFLSAYV